MVRAQIWFGMMVKCSAANHEGLVVVPKLTAGKASFQTVRPYAGTLERPCSFYEAALTLLQIFRYCHFYGAGYVALFLRNGSIEILDVQGFAKALDLLDVRELVVSILSFCFSSCASSIVDMDLQSLESILVAGEGTFAMLQHFTDQERIPERTGSWCAIEEDLAHARLDCV